MCEALNLPIGAMEVSAEVWSTSGMLSVGGFEVVNGGPARADLQFGLQTQPCIRATFNV